MLEFLDLTILTKKHSYIVTGNHESLFDIFALPAALPMHGMGVEAAYHFSLLLWGYLTRKWGNIPIQRKSIAGAAKALKKQNRLLNPAHLLSFFLKATER